MGQKTKINRQEIKGMDRRYGIPVIFILTVVPLLTMMGMYRSGIGDYPWASGYFFYDFFLLFKSGALIIAGIPVLVLAGLRLRIEKKGDWAKDQQYAFVLAAIYGGMALISALAAEERSDAFFGGFEQMEGFFVVCAYIACFCFVCLYATDKSRVSMLFRALTVGSFILSLLGALQAFGADFLTNKAFTPFFTMFMENLPDNFQGISASFGKGVSYATLYNPNYVGSYVALVLPVTVMLVIWEKNVGFRILAMASSVLQLIMLSGAGSMTGMIGVAAGALVAFLFLFSDIRKNRKVLCGVLASGAVLVGAVLVAAPGLLDRFTESTISKCSYRIASMVSSADSLQIELDSGKKIMLKWKPEGDLYSFDASDEKGKAIKLTGDSFNGVGFEGKEYSGILLTAEKAEVGKKGESRTLDVLRVTAEKKYYWDFIKKDGRLRYINRVRKTDSLQRVDSFGFDGHYDLATNRGYIWSRTLPLLKDTVLLGVGRDNFVYAFPNDDYVGKVNCGFDGALITKPHNMYMQIWVQDGMPACLALVALYLLFLIGTFRRCFRRGKLTYAQKANIAVLCSVTGYMAAGFANDSTVCVAPVFWILLGLGMAVCGKNWKE